MKKFISFVLCFALIFCSCSFAFAADWSTTDSSNLASIKSALTSGSSSIYGWVSSINSRLVYSNKSIANIATDIYNQLVGTYDNHPNHSITYWVAGIYYGLADIYDLLDPGNSNSISRVIEAIYGALTYIDGASNTIKPYLLDISNAISDYTTILNNIHNDVHKTSGTALGTVKGFSMNLSDWSTNYYSTDDLMNRQFYEVVKALYRINAGEHQGLGYNLGSYSYIDADGTQYTNTYVSSDDLRKQLITAIGLSFFEMQDSLHKTSGTALGSLTVYSSLNGNSYTYSYNSTDHLIRGFFADTSHGLARITAGYADTQTYTNWKTLQQYTFTGDSGFDTLYTWMQYIQTPIARLASVHASDEEISAREKAANNQAAVVNNFIDSNGLGAAPASSFSSVSSMSSEYKTNMNSDASPSQIWNIFNSTNMGWFSSETANQLDTTVSNTRSVSTYETPLLDQKIDNIYAELGVKK